MSNIVETKLNCKKCNRYLGKALGSVQIDELICAKCKYRNSFNIKVKERKDAKQRRYS